MPRLEPLGLRLALRTAGTAGGKRAVAPLSRSPPSPITLPSQVRFRVFRKRKAARLPSSAARRTILVRYIIRSDGYRILSVPGRVRDNFRGTRTPQPFTGGSSDCVRLQSYDGGTNDMTYWPPVSCRTTFIF